MADKDKDVKSLSPAERAKAYRSAQFEQPGKVKHQEPGWAYHWFIARETGEKGMDASRIRDIREDLYARGYEPCNGPLYTGEPRREFVPGANGAEIWRLPQAIADENFRLRKAKNDAALRDVKRRRKTESLQALMTP